MLNICSVSNYTIIGEGLSDLPQTQEWIKLWPNPAADMLNRASSGQPKLLVKIYNIDGKVLMQSRISSTLETIGVSFLAAGMYWVSIFSGKKADAIAQGKFIKNKGNAPAYTSN